MSATSPRHNHAAGTMSRRNVLRLGSAAAVALSVPLLGSCGTGNGGKKKNEISVATWGIQSEVDAFKGVIQRYKRKNPEATVTLEVKPPDGYGTSIDTRLAAGTAPDVIRLNYADVGYYAKAGAILDLSEHLDDDYGNAFETTFWNVVRYEDKPYALPHHTDTVATFYNKSAMKRLGVEIPTRIEDSWTWDQLIDMAGEIKKERIGKYAFAMNWQRYSPRWLPFLYQHGGKLLNDDQTGPAIDDAFGIETIAWTQSWFEKGFVPPTTSIRSNEAIEVLFANETIPLMLNGDWLIPNLVKEMKAEWGVTYMIRDAHMASDLGGNAVTVTKDTKDPELAVDFLKFLTNEENMSRFVTEAQFLPVRKALLSRTLKYKQRPEEMTIFKEQAAKTIPQDVGKLLAQPAFGRQIAPTVLEEQLDLAFKKSQDPEKTAKRIAAGIEEKLA